MQWKMQIGCMNGQTRSAKINGCTDIYVAKWLFHWHLDNKHELRMEVGKSNHPSNHVGGLKQQNHQAMNARTLSNPHAREKQNEKKALDQMKKKMELKWDEF